MSRRARWRPGPAPRPRRPGSRPSEGHDWDLAAAEAATHPAARSARPGRAAAPAATEARSAEPARQVAAVAEAEHVDELAVRGQDELRVVGQRVVEHLEAAHDLGALLEVGLGGIGDQLDRLRL